MDALAEAVEGRRMKVYLVESICDYEYGCRAVEGVFNSRESAEAYIEKNGGNHDLEFWSGDFIPYYVIDEWEVEQ